MPFLPRRRLTIASAAALMFIRTSSRAPVESLFLPLGPRKVLRGDRLGSL